MPSRQARAPRERAARLVAAALALRAALRAVRIPPPVAVVYQPLDYAWPVHEAYLRTYGTTRKRVLFLGMNPGPFGMAQTGVPFGEVAAVRDFLQLSGAITPPAAMHPKRPIEGFACRRAEVSGARLWGGFARRFGDAKGFFAEHFVTNYCPLAFVAPSGRNCTPDQLPAGTRAALEGPCAAHLRAQVEILEPSVVVGVGRFAEEGARSALTDVPHVRIGHVLHPSPASPAANGDWFAQATAQLVAQGIW